MRKFWGVQVLQFSWLIHELWKLDPWNRLAHLHNNSMLHTSMKFEQLLCNVRAPHTYPWRLNPSQLSHYAVLEQRYNNCDIHLASIDFKFSIHSKLIVCTIWYLWIWTTTLSWIRVFLAMSTTLTSSSFSVPPPISSLSYWQSSALCITS